MECEVRFYFPISKYEDWNLKLQQIKKLNYAGRNYEKTSQYNHPMKEFDFYSEKIDGRFRLRITKGETKSKCMISWKRRLPSTIKSNINKEEEVELTIKEDEYENLLFILNNVLHLDEIESYERYRTVYENEDVEIVLDEYPFGLAMEIEAKNKAKDAEEIIDEYIKLLGLDYSSAYRLSWDDKYLELCKSQGFESFKHVLFGKPMPEVK